MRLPSLNADDGWNVMPLKRSAQALEEIRIPGSQYERCSRPLPKHDLVGRKSAADLHGDLAAHATRPACCFIISQIIFVAAMCYNEYGLFDSKFKWQWITILCPYYSEGMQGVICAGHTSHHGAVGRSQQSTLTQMHRIIIMSCQSSWGKPSLFIRLQNIQ